MKPKTRNSNKGIGNAGGTKHDYYTSTWDKLIKKTQTNDEYLVRGDYVRSKERDRQGKLNTSNSIDSNTRRTVDPTFNEPEPVAD